jgi:hypothetical protein
MMLLDTVTLAMILMARNQFAAKQLLKDLTYRTDQSVDFIGKTPVFDYQKAVVTRACMLADHLGAVDGSQYWLQGLFDA